MRPTPFTRLSLGVTALALTLLAGCAALAGDPHAGHTTTAAGPHDMHAMCDKHRKMMGSRTPSERQAMMDEQMKDMGMSREAMAKHMAAMQDKCR